jgi:hypothetical protein
VGHAPSAGCVQQMAGLGQVALAPRSVGGGMDDQLGSGQRLVQSLACGQVTLVGAGTPAARQDAHVVTPLPQSAHHVPAEDACPACDERGIGG